MASEKRLSEDRDELWNAVDVRTVHLLPELGNEVGDDHQTREEQREY